MSKRVQVMSKSIVNIGKLRAYRFPEYVIQEAVTAERAGAFDVMPSSDMERQIIRNCAALGVLCKTRQNSYLLRDLLRRILNTKTKL